MWECVSTIRKLARERSNKRLISKNGVRRAKTQDELRLAKKKKKCTRDKKSFVSCVLSKNRERIGLLLRQDGVLLRNGREKVELACPSLLCLSPERSSNQPSKQSSAHQTCAPSTHPAPDRRKDGATVRGIRILRPGILGPAGHPRERGELLK